MFTPTHEQQQALSMAKSGHSFKIMAYAGAGKTSTLKLISENLQGQGLYLAFNKSIATEAQGKFPAHVRCQTFHSLAYRHVDRMITQKVGKPIIPAIRLGEILKLPFLKVKHKNGLTLTLSPTTLANYIKNAVAHFCTTSSSYPAPRHLILPDWMNENDAQKLRQMLYPAVENLWLQSIDPRHDEGIGHHIYLKLWALSNPSIPYDFILFDEAQDADPLMMGVLFKQHKQVIYVGDPHQQIYEWRGAINAMKQLPYPDSRLTQSFRFGEKIANIANILLNALEEKIPLSGNQAQNSTVGTLGSSQKNVILCRTNINALEHLLAGQKIGKKPILQADSHSILQFCEGAEKLKNKQPVTNVPALMYFKNWKEVQEFSEQDEGGHLKPWVRVIDRYSTQDIAVAIKKQANEQHPTYVISTVHKAKGLEWNNVEISDDFIYQQNKTSVSISKEELRLLYVACTRAQHILDINPLQSLMSDLKTKKIIYGQSSQNQYSPKPNH